MSDNIYHDGQAMSAASRVTEEFALHLVQLGDLIATLLYNVDYAPGARDKESLESVKMSKETVEIIAQLVVVLGQITGVQGSTIDLVNKMKNNADSAAYGLSGWTGGGGGSYRG